MALNKNSNVYVIGFVVVVTIVCAFIIATAATVLKPAQEAQLAANVQRNVLKVSDLQIPVGSTLEQTFNKDISVAYIDIRSGQFVNVPEDVRKNYEDVLLLNKYSKYVTQLKSIQNPAGLKDNRVAWLQRVYLVKDTTQGGYSKVILPFYGNGLWSVMYGFLAVADDGNTIDGITYYQQGETPGLGGEVENPNFTHQFVGKLIYKGDNYDTPEFKLVKSADPQDFYQVNALTGATLTSQGVNNQIRFWLGQDGYAKFLKNLHDKVVDLNHIQMQPMGGEQ